MCFSQKKTKIKCGGEALRFVERLTLSVERLAKNEGSKLHEDSQGEYEGRCTATKAPRRTKLLKQTKAAEPQEGAKARVND